MSDEWREPWAGEPDSALLRAVIETIPDTIFVKDAQGRYRLINTAGAQIVGRPIELILGQTDHELFDRDAATAIEASDRTILATGVASTHEDRTIIQGATRDYLTTKAPYRDAAGRIVGIIGIARDITERKRVEAELQASQRAEARLEGVTLAAREMAHLLNNALAMPIGAIDLLQQQPTLLASLRGLVDQAATSLRDARQCIRQFQQVVRVETKDTVVGPTLDLARSVQPGGSPIEAAGPRRAAGEPPRR